MLALQQRADTETQALKLFDDTAVAVQRRRQAGEDTRLDANVARVEAERARNQLVRFKSNCSKHAPSWPAIATAAREPADGDR